jgi:hypothetical protein
MAGRALAGKFSALKQEVVVGTRDPVQLMERTEPDARGNDRFATWHAWSAMTLKRGPLVNIAVVH